MSIHVESGARVWCLSAEVLVIVQLAASGQQPVGRVTPRLTYSADRLAVTQNGTNS